MNAPNEPEARAREAFNPREASDSDHRLAIDRYVFGSEMLLRDSPEAGDSAILLSTSRGGLPARWVERKGRTMHYPHRTSRIKRKRAIGFRARMKTTNGRKMMNRKRAAGRSLNVADK